MRNRSYYSIALILVAAVATGQGDPAAFTRIIDEGKNRNQVMNHLRHLTQGIGPRLTGSPQLQRACEWTAAKFREYGLQNVHLDQWGTVPVGFERGPRQSAKMVSPWQRTFEFTTPSWTPGTTGPTRGIAVLEPDTMEEYNRVKDKLDGSWLIVRRPVGMRGPEGQAPTAEQKQVQQLVSEHQILGKVRGARNELVHTGGTFRNLSMDNLPKEVDIRIRKSDMDDIMAGLNAGREVVLEFDIENRFLPGPVPIYNVIADIPGTEKPDEFVIISGHLDSWDGPGSQGACDNGTGSMVALEAARILMAAKVKPKRTIRFILWTGEEQGLLGSRAYVQKYKDKLDKISAVFVDDGGTNYQGGVPGVEQMAPMLREAISHAQAAFPDMPMKIDVVPNMPRGGGSDHASFNAVGVPGFFWYETGRANYGHVWHTQNDRFEEAIPEYLVQSSTNSAAVAYSIASAPTLLPRQTAAQHALMEMSERLPSIGSMDHDHHDPDHECTHDKSGHDKVFFLDNLLKTARMLGAGLR
jgi:carboxypeptidase Q